MTSTTAPNEAASSARSGVRLADRVAPSIPATFFIVLATMAPFAAQRRILNGDGDLARHLRHGLYMLQHHTLIWYDPFSFSRPGQPFVPFEYGSQLIYTAVYQISGLAGVTIFAGLLIGTVYALVARFLLRRGVDPLLVLITTGAAAILGSLHWLARPHLISWLAIVLLFGLIEADRKPKLWIYPVFFAIWANLHGGWLYGIALLGIYLVGHTVEYRFFGRRQQDRASARHFALALPLAALATLVTPMGLDLWRHLFVHLGDSYVLNHTAEFASPDFHTVFDKLLLLLLIGPLALLILSRRRMHTARFLLVLAGVWWCFTAQRNLALFGLTGLTLVALHLDSEWRKIPGGWLARRREGFAAGAAHANTAAWITCCCAALILLGAGRGNLFGEQLIGDSFDPKIFPVDAIRQARAVGLHDRVFADFIWGGYILYAWPEQKVFIDGGTDFYGTTVMRAYNDISSLNPGWRDLLVEYGINAVLTDSHGRLAHELVRTPGWSIWYCDSVAVLLRKDHRQLTGTSAAREQKLTNCAGPKPALD